MEETFTALEEVLSRVASTPKPVKRNLSEDSNQLLGNTQPAKISVLDLDTQEILFVSMAMSTEGGNAITY